MPNSCNLHQQRPILVGNAFAQSLILKGQQGDWLPISPCFASMGFYPVNPVSNEYQLTSPLFDQLIMRLKGDKIFEILTHKDSPDAIYIGKVYLNGKLYDNKTITYDQIMAGGNLEIWLQAEPGNWGNMGR